MKRLALLSILVAAVFAAAPATAQYYAAENAIRIRAGLFTPEANGEYFDGIFTDFTGNADDFEDGTLGVEYSRQIAPALDLVVGGSYFESTQSQAYRDFEDADGFPIVHDTTLELSNFDLGLRLRLAPSHSPVIPYVGGGGTVVAYRLIERGDFIDFNPPPPEIFSDHFETEGAAVGYFLMAGLDIPIGRDFGLFVEGRWRDAKDDLADDFADLGEIDLSGREITGGVTWRF
jgi:hypothetical protein